MNDLKREARNMRREARSERREARDETFLPKGKTRYQVQSEADNNKNYHTYPPCSNQKSKRLFVPANDVFASVTLKETKVLR